MAADKCGRAAGVQEEIAFIRERRPMMSVLTDMLGQGSFPTVTQTTPSSNNVMLDDVVGKPVV